MNARIVGDDPWESVREWNDRDICIYDIYIYTHIYYICIYSICIYIYNIECDPLSVTVA